MKNALMLIESPNKVNTISRYLVGKDIKIMATIGHIRELDEKKFKGLGFDEKTYDMAWRNDSIRTFKGKTMDIIKEINKEADKCEKIYLSTDPDREGEAISWHIYSVLNNQNKKKCVRIVFNEITKTAIEKALNNPRKIDDFQINSYLARKLLDRGIGFKLSKFVSKAVGGASAGRVQSIALKFLKDRDDEIKNFVPECWFNLIVILENDLELTLKALSKEFKATLNEKLKNGHINFCHKDEAEKFKKSLGKHYTLIAIEDPVKEKRKPPKAFKTSTLQSTAINHLHMGASSVDRIAQRLYEGVEIDGESISLITYPRTDREDLSDTFVKDAKDFIKGTYSAKYVGGNAKSSSKSKNQALVQGAHEAIRPTYIDLTPAELKGKIGDAEHRMYSLIWCYAVASLMSDAEYENVVYKFDNNNNLFTANSRRETFDGFRKLFRDFFEDVKEQKQDFPTNLKKNEKYLEKLVEVKQVDKKPPSNYTEASLIDALESEGIGRPSTYSHIVSIVLNRGYANKEKSKLLITDLGIKMSDFLEMFFPEIMKYEYTRNMEKELDSISEDKTNWKKFLDAVFSLFSSELEKANQSLITVNSVGRNCEKCNSPLIYKFSHKTKNKYISCSNSKCDFVEWLDTSEREELDEECPECGHKLVRRKNKWDNFFVSCSNFPACRYIKHDKDEREDIDRNCDQCGHKLFKRKNRWGRYFISCSNYPKCKYIESLDDEDKEILEEECPECHSKLVKLTDRYNKPFIRCSSYPTCRFRKRRRSPRKVQDE